jgi:aspartate-semialdehyde dehydrogenase
MMGVRTKVGSVGVMGALGVVGSEMVKCLEERNFPTEKLRLLDKQCIGETRQTKFGPVVVEDATVEAASECDIVFMAVGDDVAEKVGMKIAGGPNKTVCIDNSAQFRYEKDVPLCIPEINSQTLKGAKYVSNPNCTTAIGAMALWPLHKKFGLKKVIMSTYQASSGAGAPGMAELESSTRAWAKDPANVPKNEVFAHQLLFNVIPHIDKFQPNGYTKEEMKVAWEINKIFGEDIKVSCTAVRIPTLRAHSEAIVIETEKPIDAAGARAVLEAAKGINVVDDPSTLKYPMPLNTTGKWDVEVGRLRTNLCFGDHGLEFFVSGDQLLRGAALNAVLIGEEVVKMR